jgi:hypothetical protein
MLLVAKVEHSCSSHKTKLEPLKFYNNGPMLPPKNYLKVKTIDYVSDQTVAHYNIHLKKEIQIKRKTIKFTIVNNLFIHKS